MPSSTLNGRGTRGIRDRFNSGTLLGTLPGSGKGIPIQRLTTAQVATVIANSGATPLPSQISSAALDAVFGSTEGDILQRGASVWQVLAPGTNGQVLTSQGAAALNHWAAVAGGTTLSNAGAWNSTAGYTPGQVVQWLSSSYLNYVAVAAAVAGPAQWDPGDKVNATISTTNTTNDTITSTGAGHGCTLNNGQTSSKWYYEFVATNLLDNNFALGAATTGGADTGKFIGGSALGQFLDNFPGGVSGGAWAGLHAGNREGVCIDLTNQLFWITADVTAVPIVWNGSALNTPGTGAGGYTLGAPATQVFQHVYFPASAAQKVVLYNGSGTTLIPAIPTGFSLWGAPAVANIPPDLDITHWVAQGNQNPANLNEHALLGGV